MTGITCVLAGTGGSGADSGTMTAGTNGGYTGYMNSAVATVFGVSAFGSSTGTATSFGTLGGLYIDASIIRGVALSSGVGTPSSINIDGTPYTLTYSSTNSGYDFYSLSSSPGFSAGSSYNWTLS